MHTHDTASQTTTNLPREAYIFARTKQQAEFMLGLPDNRAARYPTEEVAMKVKQSGNDGFDGERLWRRTNGVIEEVV